jgi:hypothetical protein
MAQVTGAFPYDIDNLLGGAVRILYADPTVVTAVPSDISQVIDMVAPYTPKTNWKDFGATKESFTYSRGFDTSGWEIQQVAGSILEEVSDITRTVQLSMAEVTQETMKIFDQGVAGTVAAAAGKSAQKVVKFGSFKTPDKVRVAFVSRRHTGSGLVTEPGGTTRGRFVMGVGYSCALTADSIDMEQNKGDLTAVGLTFRLFPESGQTVGQEHGAWFLEDAGTIA